MTTRSLQIRDAILTKLRATLVAGVTSERVFSDIKPALLSALRPAIVVDMGDEETPERKYGKVHRGQAITVRIIEDATDPYAALDPIRIAAHARIMSQPTVYTVTSSAWSGGYLTCNVGSAAGLMAGSKVYFANMQTALNVVWTVHDIPTGATSFRIAMSDPTLTDGIGIATDITLSSLITSIEEGATSRYRDDLDVPIGLLTTTYLARYTTTAELLT